MSDKYKAELAFNRTIFGIETQLSSRLVNVSYSTFNRTIFGIETIFTKLFKPYTTMLLIAPFLELKPIEAPIHKLKVQSFNRTIFGIETR